MTTDLQRQGRTDRQTNNIRWQYLAQSRCASRGKNSTDSLFTATVAKPYLLLEFDTSTFRKLITDIKGKGTL